jgi:hypothetical protein
VHAFGTWGVRDGFVWGRNDFFAWYFNNLRDRLKPQLLGINLDYLRQPQLLLVFNDGWFRNSFFNSGILVVVIVSNRRRQQVSPLVGHKGNLFTVAFFATEDTVSR